MAKPKIGIPAALDLESNQNYVGIHSGSTDPQGMKIPYVTEPVFTPQPTTLPTGTNPGFPTGTVLPAMTQRPDFRGLGRASELAGFGGLKQAVVQMPEKGGARNFLRGIYEADPLNTSIPTPAGSTLTGYFKQNPDAKMWMLDWINQKIRGRMNGGI